MENVFFALIAGFAIGFYQMMMQQMQAQLARSVPSPSPIYCIGSQNFNFHPYYIAPHPLRSAHPQGSNTLHPAHCLTRQVARLNYSDIQRLSAYTGGYSDTAHIPQ